MKKQIELTVEEARNLYGRVSKDDAMAYFIRANFTEEELNPKPKLPKNWVKLETITGYWISKDSSVCLAGTCFIAEYDNTDKEHKNVFATKKQAESALAMAQLSQLMKVYNDGWEADWNDGTDKACIIRRSSNIAVCYYTSVYQFLTFKTQLIRDEFLKNFEPLIRQYFMLDYKIYHND
jgi:hypothetical protein